MPDISGSNTDAEAGEVGVSASADTAAADSSGTEGKSQALKHRHDRFVKAVLGMPRNAASLLADILPPQLAGELRLEELQPVPTEYISPILQERELDLAFMVPMGDGEALLHCLIDLEHQFENDPLMAFRCWKYAALMTEAWVKAHPHAKSVPPVISVVVHQGGKGTWSAPTKLAELYDVGAATLQRIRHRLYTGEYTLDDLGAADVAALRARRLNPQTYALVLVLTIEPHSSSLYEDMLGHKEELQAASREPGGDLLLALYSYLDSSPKMTSEELNRLYDQLGPEGQEAAVTMAQLNQTKGAARLLLRQLTRKFGKLPDSVATAVNDASEGDLETWGDRVLTATTLDDVFR